MLSAFLFWVGNKYVFWEEALDPRPHVFVNFMLEKSKCYVRVRLLSAFLFWVLHE
jgi:hypothetical protein